MRFVHVVPGQSLVSKLWSINFQSAGLLISVPGKTTNAPVIHKTQSSFLSHSAFKTGVWGAQQWLGTNNSFNLDSKLARFCSALIMFLTQWRPILNWFIRRTDVVWVVSCIKAYPRQVYISFFTAVWPGGKMFAAFEELVSEAWLITSNRKATSQECSHPTKK